MTILVCDDDKEIVEAVSIYLNQEGYEVLSAYNGREALELVKKKEIHLIILDIMMPELDGIHALLKLREKSSIPVILLSAKSEDVDKILGLNVGADDYVTKPFNPLELVARVKSQLRRYTKLGGLEVANGNLLVNGSIIMDREQKIVTVDGENVKLTPTEFKIMQLFMENPGIVFSSAQIYERVWDEDAFSTENIVSVHIRRIREKVEINPKNPDYIKVMWGVGYRMEKKD
ncbi:MAG: response regulator transcription factor [Lachnospiraceae bacterium]|nr:response regulator transcription factor [Lachnospiraceae bacterium]